MCGLWKNNDYDYEMNFTQSAAMCPHLELLKGQFTSWPLKPVQMKRQKS